MVKELDDLAKMGDWKEDYRGGEGRWSAFGHEETCLVCRINYPA
jgi:hypothetical protein